MGHAGIKTAGKRDNGQLLCFLLLGRESKEQISA